MQRYLGPALLALVLAVVFVRAVSDPSREPRRARIAATWDLGAVDPAEREARIEQVEAYLADYGDAEADRWFGARAYLKLGLPDRAQSAIFGSGDAGRDASRRYGELLLRHWGFHDDVQLSGPRAGVELCLLALAEGGDPLALARVDEIVSERERTSHLRLYYGTLLLSTSEVRHRVAALLRAREDTESHVAAALSVLGAEPYEDRQKDLDRLRALLRGPERRQQRNVWGVACFALGRTGEPQVLAELGALVNVLSQSPQAIDREDAALAALGLIAAGDDTAEVHVVPFLGGERRSGLVFSWYMASLLHRVRLGDAAAVDRLMGLWDTAGAREGGRVRRQIATDLLLRDGLPGDHVPVDRMLATLEGSASSLAERTIAAAWRLRRGEDGARDRVLHLLSAIEAAGPPFEGDDGLVDPQAPSPRLIAARALWLYGGGQQSSSAH